MAKITDYASLKSNVQTYLAYDDIEAMFDTWLGLAESKFRRDIRVREMEASLDFSVDQTDSSVTLPSGFTEIVDLYETGANGGALDYLPPQKFWSLDISRSGTGQPAYYTIIGDRLHFAPRLDTDSVNGTLTADLEVVGSGVFITTTDQWPTGVSGGVEKFYIGDETLGYEFTNAAVPAYFIGVTRGLDGTTAVAHAAGDSVFYSGRRYKLNYLKEFTGLSATASTNALLTLAPDVYLYGILYEAQPYLADAARSAEFEGLYRKSIDSLHAADNRARHRPRGRMYAEGVTPDGAFRI